MVIKSFLSIKKNKDPKRVPCGTPEVTSDFLERFPSYYVLILFNEEAFNPEQYRTTDTIKAPFLLKAGMRNFYYQKP